MIPPELLAPPAPQPNPFIAAVRAAREPRVKMKLGVSDEVHAWVARRLGLGDTVDAGPFTTLAILDDDGPLAGVVYHRWIPSYGTVEMSMASKSPRWLTRRVLHTMFAYPFRSMRMVVLRCEPQSQAHKLLVRGGFHEYVVPDMRGEGRPEVILTGTRDMWRLHWARQMEVDHGR